MPGARGRIHSRRWLHILHGLRYSAM